ncbi:acyl carrier protein [Kitasatospora purpeofusca]|uniref:acyl carrier protein n=1 Tax=Kitasatospora purpeofusca TaxID=67352 RepID=UPI0035D57772
MAGVAQRVKKIIAKTLDVTEEEVTPEKSIRNDLATHDIEIQELIMALEDEFEITIPDEEAERMTTPGKVVAYLESLED